jgi:hypothetical protein
VVRAEAIDAADVLLLDRRLPCRTHDHLAAESLVFDRLITEQTGQNIV